MHSKLQTDELKWPIELTCGMVHAAAWAWLICRPAKLRGHLQLFSKRFCVMLRLVAGKIRCMFLVNCLQVKCLYIAAHQSGNTCKCHVTIGFAVDFSAYLYVHDSQISVCRGFISGSVLTASGSENPTASGSENATASGSQNSRRIKSCQTPYSQQPFIVRAVDW